jgi:hypothetical protein
MKFDLNAVLKNPDDTDVPTSATDKSAFTANQACRMALLSDTDENKATKELRYGIFVKLKMAGEELVELTNEEVTVIKAQLSISYPTVIAGQVMYIIEQGKKN